VASGYVLYYINKEIKENEPSVVLRDGMSKLFLFGSPISKSPSPLLHNTGFRYYNISWVYSLCDTTDINTVVSFIKNPDTLGGSVTMPHKQVIIPHLNELTPAAKQIGAVNTVYKVEKNGKEELHGDNTDWIAIYSLTKLRLQEIHGPNVNLKNLTALVIGAGGTAHAACYALSQLNIPFYIWNRTADKAQELAKHFGGKPCTSLESLQSIDVAIGTVPPTSQFKLPQHLLKQSLLVVELVYFPRDTELVKQALSINAVIIEGSELLFEQGVKQFEIWSGKPAPRKAMAAALVNEHNNGALREQTPLTFARELTNQHKL